MQDHAADTHTHGSVPMRASSFDCRAAVSLFLGTALLLLAVSTRPAAAQPEPASLVFTPRIGVLVPLDPIGRSPSIVQVEGAEPELVDAELTAGVVLGFAVTYDAGRGPVIIRADVDVAPGLAVRLDGRRSAFDANLAMVTAGVMTRSSPTGLILPFIQAGVGFRSFGTRVSVSHGPQVPDHRIDPLARLGGGADIATGAVTFRFELASQLATFRFDREQGIGGERHLHTDLAASAGVRIGIR